MFMAYDDCVFVGFYLAPVLWSCHHAQAFVIFRRGVFGRLSPPGDDTSGNIYNLNLWRKKTMKKRIRTMVIAFLTAAISCITVFAATGYQSAQIYYKNIKIIIDGEQITPKDVLGNIVDPFIMDGTTYLPVRAVSEALGMDVVWDGKTYTVYLNTPAVPPPPKPKVTYMFDVLQAYEKQGSYTKITKKMYLSKC